MRKIVLQALTSHEVHAVNRTAVLELIRNDSPISRTEIAERLGIGRHAVRRISDALIQEGLVRPNGRFLLEFNGGGGVMIGVDLGGTKIYGEVADFNGSVLHALHITQHHTQSEESYRMLCSLIDRLLEYAHSRGLPVRGLGVGVPGVVNQRTGGVELAPSLQWNGFPLRPRLAEQYALPVVVENDVNLAAVGEFWFNPAVEGQNLVLIAIGTGIGAGIIIDGRVLPGVNDMAGEVGYLLPERACLGQAYPGFGALEQAASGTGIAERARRLLQNDPGGQRFSDSELANLGAEEVFDAARHGEAWAKTVLDETVDTLAQAIAAVNQVLDPGLILLGGGVARSADLLIEPILARLRGAIPILPRLEAASLGYRAAVMGAMIQLLHTTSSDAFPRNY